MLIGRPLDSSPPKPGRRCGCGLVFASGRLFSLHLIGNPGCRRINAAALRTEIEAGAARSAFDAGRTRYSRAPSGSSAMADWSWRPRGRV